MKKRFLSLLLTLCMVLILMPTTVRAEENTEHKHCLCGTSHTSVGNHTGEVSVTFTAWNDSSSLPKNAGNYYLTTDVTISGGWSPKAGTVLCLNGHNINNTAGNCISIYGDRTFTLTDCKG